MLLCPEESILNIYHKNKNFPLEVHFVTPNLKTWLRACLWPGKPPETPFDIVRALKDLRFNTSGMKL